jgi:hypothetical protein
MTAISLRTLFSVLVIAYFEEPLACWYVFLKSFILSLGLFRLTSLTACQTPRVQYHVL